MPSIETSIWLALKARVDSLALSPPIAVAFPKDASFTRPQTTTTPPRLLPYIEVLHFLNRPRRLFHNGSEPHQRLGILQLTLIYPVSSQHDAVTDIEIAGQIAAHFPADLPLYRDGLTVRITEAPEIARGFEENGDWRTPISIRWACFA